MDWLGILTGFALGCAGLALGLWAYTLLLGRLPKDAYHEHLNSPEWAEVCAKLETQPRGRRCAACLTRFDLGDPHHWTYRNLGYEMTWQLVRLCHPHHRAVHDASERLSLALWLLTLTLWDRRSRTTALWVVTPAMIWGTRLLGRRTRATTVRRTA